jgi:hypothetical protein
MNFTINNSTARMVYEESLEVAAQANLNPDNTKNTMSDLVLEQQLLTTSTNYQFPVLSNQNGNQGNQIFNTEVRLAQQDSFIASSWGVFLLKPTSAVDTTFIAQTYPNPQVFTTGGVSASAETIYNSTARITVNNDVILPVWHLSRHRYVPQTQEQPLIAGVENGIPYSQIDLTTDGFYPVEPFLIFIGSKNNVINVILASNLTAVETFMRLRIHFRGLLLQNSTIIS